MDDLPYHSPIELREALASRLAEIRTEMKNLESEASRLNEEVHLADEFLKLWRRQNNVPGPTQPASTRYEIRSDVPIPKPKPRNPPREEVVEACMEIISAAGKPLSRQELYDGLLARGMQVYGKDPQMVLSTMLWRSQEQIVRLPSFGYWLRSEPYDQAVYFPEFDELIGAASNEPDGEIEDPDDNEPK